MSQFEMTAANLRKLSDYETNELRKLLKRELKSPKNLDEDDSEDLLDYAFAMITNGKSIKYIVEELTSMDMDVCNSTSAINIGDRIQKFMNLNDESIEETYDGDSSELSPKSKSLNAIDSSATPVTREVKKSPNIISFGSVKTNNALRLSGALYTSRKIVRKKKSDKNEQSKIMEISRDGIFGKLNTGKRKHHQRKGQVALSNCDESIENSYCQRVFLGSKERQPSEIATVGFRANILKHKNLGQPNTKCGMTSKEMFVRLENNCLDQKISFSSNKNREDKRYKYNNQGKKYIGDQRNDIYINNSTRFESDKDSCCKDNHKTHKFPRNNYNDKVKNHSNVNTKSNMQSNFTEGRLNNNFRRIFHKKQHYYNKNYNDIRTGNKKKNHNRLSSQ